MNRLVLTAAAAAMICTPVLANTDDLKDKGVLENVISRIEKLYRPLCAQVHKESLEKRAACEAAYDMSIAAYKAEIAEINFRLAAEMVKPEGFKVELLRQAPRDQLYFDFFRRVGNRSEAIGLAFGIYPEVSAK